VTNQRHLFVQSKIVSDLQKQVLKLQRKIEKKNMEAARNKADQQEGMINVLQKKSASANVQRRPVPSTRPVKKALPKDNDENSSGGDEDSSDKEDDDVNDESSEESEKDAETDDDMNLVVKDFRWSSIEKKKGI
jgi:hypothetical protein